MHFGCHTILSKKAPKSLSNCPDYKIKVLFSNHLVTPAAFKWLLPTYPKTKTFSARFAVHHRNQKKSERIVQKLGGSLDWGNVCLLEPHRNKVFLFSLLISFAAAESERKCAWKAAKLQVKKVVQLYLLQPAAISAIAPEIRSITVFQLMIYFFRAASVIIQTTRVSIEKATSLVFAIACRLSLDTADDRLTFQLWRTRLFGISIRNTR